MEILAPIIEFFMQLIYPFFFVYSIIHNLTRSQIHYLETPGTIIVGVYKNEFTNLNEILDFVKGVIDILTILI